MDPTDGHTASSSFDETLAGDVGDDVAPSHEAVAGPRSDRVGRYVLLEEIGRGAMGVVHSAYDPELDRKIAIKILDTRKAGGGRASLGERRLLREAQAIAKLQHPNVIAVYDVGVANDAVFLAMELVDGETLGKWARPEMPAREVLAAYIQAGQGLAAAHAVGMVHRDFKPDNVLVDVHGRARVLDFGLARRFDDDSETPVADPLSTAKASALQISDEATIEQLQRLTRTGGIAGTPAYMSPEQFEGSRVDARSDQFSFCVALLEALDGVRPFEGDDLPTLVYAVSHGKFREPPVDSKTPSWVRAILQRGLSPKAADRHASMDELLGALQRDPARRRRTYAAAGLLVVGAAAGIFALGDDDARRADPCEATSQMLADSWNDADRAAIRSALTSGDAPYAAQTWEAVERTLDGYADDWTAMRRDACEAFEVDARQPAHVHTRRVRCLERRQEDLEMVVEILTDMKPDAIASAEPTTTALRPVSACGDVERLLARLEPPADPKIREAVGAVRTDLNRARTLKLAGRHADALELASRTLDAPVVEQYAPVRAEAHYWRGAIAVEHQDYDGAREHYIEAIAAAYEGRHDDYLLATMVGLPWASHRAEDATFVETNARWARALIARAGGNAVEESKLENGLGAYYRRAGDLERAYAHLEKGIELKGDEDSPQNKAMSINNLGDISLLLGNLDEARAHGEAALALRLEHLGPDHPHTAMSHLNLGNVASRKAEYDVAQRHYETALAIYERVEGADGERVALVHGNLGVLASRRGDDTAAIASIERALEIRQQRLGRDHPALLNNVGNLAQLYQGQGRAKEAVVFGRRAVALTASLVDKDPRRITPRWVLATALDDDGQTTAALSVAKQAEEAAKTALGDEHVRTARMRLLVARLHFKLEDIDQAVTAATAALAHLDDTEDAEGRAEAQAILDLAKRR